MLKKLLPIIRSIHGAEKSGSMSPLPGDGDRPEHAGSIGTGLSTIPLRPSTELGMTHRQAAPALPYAVLIGEDGFASGQGPGQLSGATGEPLHRQTGVASIQGIHRSAHLIDPINKENKSEMV